MNFTQQVGQTSPAQTILQNHFNFQTHAEKNSEDMCL